MKIYSPGWFTAVFAASALGFAPLQALLSQPVRVSSALSDDRDVGEYFMFSPDGLYAVYTSNTGDLGINELVRVRLATGQRTVGLSDLNVVDTSGRIKVTADSKRVVFIGAKGRSLARALYSIEFDGSTPVPIATPNTERNGVQEFKLSADGKQVLYTADIDGRFVYDLYISNVDGTERRKVSGAETSLGRILNFDLSQDGEYAVYQVRHPVSGSVEIFSASTKTGVITNLSGTMSAGRDASNYYVTRDSTRVVFRADADVNDIFDLYSVPIFGGVRKKISGASNTRGGIRFPWHFRISPDSTRVVFITAKSPQDNYRIFSADAVTGDVVELTGPLNAGGNVFEFQITSDGKSVVFSGDLERDGVSALYIAPIQVGTRTAIFSNDVGGVDRFSLCADNSRVVFSVQEAASSSKALYSSRLQGGNNVLLASGGSVPNARFIFEPTSNCREVVYQRETIFEQKFGLFSVPVDGGPIGEISGELHSAASVSSMFQISGDGARVLYRVDASTDNVFELYRVQTSGKALAIDIDGDDNVFLHTDFLMVSRYLLGYSGESVTLNATSPNATLSDTNSIGARIRYVVSLRGEAGLVFDFDGDEHVFPFTDLLLLARFQLGIRGSALIDGALGANATITSPAAIEERIRAALRVNLSF